MVPHLAEGIEKLEGYLAGPDRQRVRESFFGSQTKVRRRRASIAVYNDVIGTVAFDNEDMVMEKLDLVDEADKVAALAAVAIDDNA